MTSLENFIAHSKERLAELTRLKQDGTKIIGYVPNGYMPEELVYASGAIPVGLVRGGDHEAIMASESHLFRLLDSFCRSQIGYRALGKEPLYQLPDLMVVPITDRNINAIADSWEFSTDVAVFKYGVPRYKSVQHAFEYYVEGLKLLKQRLEKLTGNQIENKKLKEEIELSNKINHYLEVISTTRKNQHSGISGKDFIRLNHASYYADRRIFLSSLESIFKEVTEGQYLQKAGARIMLVGSTMAEGDNKVVDLIEQAGGNIIIEEFSEGIRPHTPNIETDGDLIKNLADVYLEKRIPPAVFHNVIKERFDYLLKLIREFRINGVVWYSLMYRDCYDREGLLFSQVLDKEVGIPFLKINSDYDAAETGQMLTRIETFIEIVKQGR
ncbi:MAG: 2-hydroxyacyl-CoA dehydratase family protein [Dehalococcoidales bacterium]|nr:2-hydroxyacyl-CoA dehydratase family protein [Dehalococcoidales bacterium]